MWPRLSEERRTTVALAPASSTTFAGQPDILADTPIVTVGFRPEVNGLWRCGGANRIYDATYKTTSEVEALEEGKS